MSFSGSQFVARVGLLALGLGVGAAIAAMPTAHADDSDAPADASASDVADRGSKATAAVGPSRGQSASPSRGAGSRAKPAADTVAAPRAAAASGRALGPGIPGGSVSRALAAVVSGGSGVTPAATAEPMPSAPGESLDYNQYLFNLKFKNTTPYPIFILYDVEGAHIAGTPTDQSSGRFPTNESLFIENSQTIDPRFDTRNGQTSRPFSFTICASPGDTGDCSMSATFTGDLYNTAEEINFPDKPPITGQSSIAGFGTIYTRLVATSTDEITQNPAVISIGIHPDGASASGRRRWALQSPSIW